MDRQNYQNHVRYYPPHHFIFYPVMLVLLGLSTYFASRNGSDQLVWTFIILSFLMTAWVSVMLRQHYALNNQNRIVRLEMRFRYYVLTGQRLELLENQLSFGQIGALRFASDDELPDLLTRTLHEKLSPDEIKKAITNWQGDYMRV